MPDELCPNHPICREDLIKRINLRMQTKTFWTALGSVLAIIGIILTLVYMSYAAEKRTIEAAITKQTDAVQKADKKLTEVEVNQQHVMKNQEALGRQVEAVESNQHLILQEIIKIREHQTNDD